ncbi:MAG: hypothetical protein ACYCXW_11850, partial [Solirubrobacteraceae bacterium]
TGLGLLEIAWQGEGGLLIGLAIAGLGLGSFTPANNATIMAAAPRGRAGLVSGLLNMTRGLGTAMGVAIASLLYTTAAGSSGARTAHIGVSAARHGLTVSLIGLAIAAMVVGVALLARPTDSGTGADPGIDADPELLAHSGM